MPWADPIQQSTIVIIPYTTPLFNTNRENNLERSSNKKQPTAPFGAVGRGHYTLSYASMISTVGIMGEASWASAPALSLSI